MQGRSVTLRMCFMSWVKTGEAALYGHSIDTERVLQWKVEKSPIKLCSSSASLHFVGPPTS